MKNSILFVDDDPNILSSLKRVLRSEDYQLFFAGSGREGLEILGREKIDLVISDYKMPEMNGSELLKKVQAEYPDIMRIMLSGFVEHSDMLAAVQFGLARNYITKPWDSEQLKNRLRHLFDIRNSIMTSNNLKIISSLKELPALPALHSRISGLIEQDREIGEIAAEIEKEPSYVAKILRITNSAFTGVSFISLKDALVFLGRSAIKDIIIYSELFDFLETGRQGVNTLHILWDHFHLCNILTHDLYRLIFQKKLPDHLGSVGLLHDAGKILLAKYFFRDFRQSHEKWRKSPDVCSCDLEQEILGTNHALLGGYLLDWWNLPEYYAEICLYHHDPLAEKNRSRELCSIVHLADSYAWQHLGDGKEPAVRPEVCEFLNVEKKDLDAHIKKNPLHNKTKNQRA
ncbi:MAG: hypothetical protein A2096_03745 [Spirochaetes bacterium GWF1_41_5]|nr:MAG: hypothetical protein A2096_03745 [Spirochaetes bacterium GWF1_41_5]HBE02797.1 hypothetical protein [Spirochaetia bacterium]